MVALLSLLLLGARFRFNESKPGLRIDRVQVMAVLADYERRLQVAEEQKLPLSYTVTDDIDDVATWMEGSALQGPTYGAMRVRDGRAEVISVYPCHEHELAHVAIDERWGYRAVDPWVEEGLAETLARGRSIEPELEVGLYWSRFPEFRREESYGVARWFVTETLRQGGGARFITFLGQGGTMEAHRSVYPDLTLLGQVVQYPSQ